MVDFEWYRSFVAVYRSGTVTGAAQARFLTQPAISQHLAALEMSTGHSLFQRTPRKMIPSEQGKALYSRLAPSMDALEKLSTHLKDQSITEKPLLRLGSPLDYLHQAGLQKLKDSGFQLQIELGDTEKLINAISAGKLDAIIATQQLDGSHIDYTPIDKEEFCLVAAAKTQLPANLATKEVKTEKIEPFLLQQTWISYSSELPIIRRFWQIAFQRRPEIEPLMTVPSLLAIHQAVELGMGISVLPRYLCEDSFKSGKLKILWEPPSPVVNDLWIATRKVDRNKVELERLISLMKNILN